MDMFLSTPNATASQSQWPDSSFSFIPADVPFYFTHKSRLIDKYSDEALTLAAPVLSYWFLSLFFHYLDTRTWQWLEKYRIHESAEVQKKNRATRLDVVKAVFFQQVIQTLLGILWLSEPTTSGTWDQHLQKMGEIAATVAGFAHRVLGEKVGEAVLRANGRELVYFVYWWAIPSAQFLAAIFFIDTWQYFLHRGMHMNTFMYKQFHSWHHRLNVPYAFGALYNHPVEGFLLDTLGAALAEYVTGMTTRQAMLLFTVSTFKTVDDHCGYTLPWDPLQFITKNNANYHDIHHQTIGIKSNFAQPFFIHWDTLLGTRMTREEMEELKRKRHQKKE
ncbi:hypothetical protein PC9H_006277 [Pleurotus ostreatus]|uniref:Fatty acid hydroxylase domain-containing protein n=2 Tax=Pleurotus TaxID=5320 RepID=A0A8H6ZTH5_PLEOS|nr:uncharacterized protein PC9H_006277 [Pleurotus ostreatus]KAF7430569.1 hypothetical protein PC9H_006277 [Pleurotus ostreatus]KAG9223768.1 hypothetical protein CCMSSC00406_0004891 [Pleurotus cornucopiae]KAJ8694862.1 Sphingolipid C4-hydroxylase sur2 [Pleurotus ostreatus]